jgi:protein-S-isoprenylcysteine O-methyltransferase Ste14
MALQEELESQGNFLFKYRGTLPLVILVVALGILFESAVNNPEINAYNEFSIYTLISLKVALFGLLIRIYTVGHTPKHTSGRNTEEQVADVLNSTGIYSTVRHPLYVGNFFMWLGVGMLTMNLWFLVAFTFFYWVYYERIMFAEEQFLRRKFGDAYLSWAAGTPAFWPSFKNFKKPVVKFSWAKVIKKEKNGLLAIFVCFFAFQLFTQSIIEGEFTLKQDVWLYSTAASIMVYYFIKFLRKFTKVLEEAPK